MHSLLEIRTLILVITVLLVCRAATMAYLWVIAKQYAPVKDWATGSALMAIGALLVGLRDLIPVFASVFLGQTLLILGWLTIDAGIVIAARQKPPWRSGLGIASLALFMTYWTLLVVPDFPLRTLFNGLPGIFFDSYAAIACLRSRVGRRSATLTFLAVMLALLAGSNALKTAFIFNNDVQAIFSPDWQIGQFYLASIVSTVLTTAVFTLLTVQRLQEQFERELVERTRIANELNSTLMQAERFRLALDKVPAYVYMKDLESRYIYANRPTLDLFGCTAKDLIGSSDARFFPPDAAARLRKIDSIVFSGKNSREEVDIADTQGRRRVYIEVKTPLYADSENTVVNGLCGISTDITDIKEHERHLERVAQYDALTQLPNRILLSDRLNQALIQSKRRQTTVTVAFLDLDGFKVVNDTYGHDVGDALLIGLSKRMLEALRQGDTLARLGGDEFIAVIADLESAADCEPVLERLLNSAAEPITIGEVVLQVSASIGVTVYPEDDSDVDLLLRHADQAMYWAKRAGKNCFHRFDPATDVALAAAR